jgi:acyl-CoA synthetase (AMP-forming)/AMP-acid ligase II
LARQRAALQPDKIAYLFLADGEHRAEQLTHGALDRQARRIGCLLQASYSPGERALLVFPPGLPYVTAFFGCLYAGVVAVPAYPPLSLRQVPRLKAVIDDAKATVALVADSPFWSGVASADLANAFGEVTWLPTDQLEAGLEDGWREPAIGTEDLAFLQYTSGSTLAPRGVMLSHANLLHNLDVMHEWFTDSTDDLLVSWLPPYHDMGLIGSILEPLYGGFPAVLMSPAHFLERPHRWIHVISRYRATVSPAPDFGYSLCARRAASTSLDGIDLSCWRLAVNGAEPVRAETLDRFVDVFAPYGFRREALRPAYGLAEATLLVAGDPAGSRPTTAAVPKQALQTHDVRAPVTDPASRTLVACGRPLGGQRLAIVDAATSTPLPPGQVGEIWLSGPSVAEGYWGRPEQTQAIFRARLRNAPSLTYLRTGDLGFQDEAGRLFVTGRLKDLIIIHGRNHYPQDIESAVQGCDPSALRPGCGAAFSVPVNGEEVLVVVQELRTVHTVDVEGLAARSRRAVLEECGVDLHALALIEPRTIPKTSSGKIQRRVCREAFLAGTLPSVGQWQVQPAAPASAPFQAPRNPVEELLTGIWADVLGVQRVGVHDNFLELGGHSLLAEQLVLRIRDALPVDVSVTDVFEALTVASLAKLLFTRDLTEDSQRLAELIDDLETAREVDK